MPVRQVFPVGPVENRIQANALQRHATLFAAQGRSADIVQPGHPALADMACFGDEHRPLVAPRQLVEHVRQIAAPRVFQVPVQPVVRWVFPLVAVVIVDGRDVEVAGRTAQARLQVATQHVPCLELQPRQVACLVMAIRRFGLGHGDVDQGIGVNHARCRQDRPQRIAALHDRADQIALEVESVRACIRRVRVHQVRLRDSPAEK